VSDYVYAQIWDAERGTELLRSRCHFNVRFAEFAPDGESFIAGAADGQYFRWNARTGETLAAGRHGHNPLQATHSPDGDRLAVAAADGAVRLFEARTFQLMAERFHHDAGARSAAWSPDGLRLGTGGDDRTARIWNLATGKAISRPFRFPSWVRDGRFTADGRGFFAHSDWCMAAIVDTDDGRAHPLHLGRRAILTGGKCSNDGTKVALGWSDGVVEWRDPRTGTPLGKVEALRSPIRTVELSADGRRLMALDEVNMVHVVDTASRQIQSRFRIPDADVIAAHLSPDGSRVITTSAEGRAILWDASDGRLVATLRRDPFPVVEGVFSANGEWVVTIGIDSRSIVSESATGRTVGVPFWNTEHHGVQFSPDGSRVLTAGAMNVARVFDWRTGNETTSQMRHENQIRSARFSRDGRRIVTASTDRTVRVWNADTGQILIPPIQHPAAVNFAEFDPTGRRLVTACADGVARLFDATTGMALSEPLRGGTDMATAYFDFDGTHVLTIPRFGQSAQVWDVPEIRTREALRLSRLAESIVQLRQTDAGIIEHVETMASSDFRRELATAEPGDPIVAWADWFFADRRTRMTTPWSGVPVRTWMEQILAVGSWEALREAAQFQPDQPEVLAGLARYTIDHNPGKNTRPVEEADWLSRQAIRSGPSNALAVAARATWLIRRNRDEEALRLLEALPESARTHGLYWLDLGHAYQRAGRHEEAVRALSRAVEMFPNSKPADEGGLKWSLIPRSVSLRALGRVEEGARDFNQAWHVAPRDSAATPRHVNLDRFYNHALDQDLANEAGHTWAAVPYGLVTLSGVTFDLRGIVGTYCPKVGPPTGNRTGPIPVGLKGRRIHFLHMLTTPADDGATNGAYVMHYADGRRATLPLIREENIDGPWWPEWRPRKLGTNCIVAWSGATRYVKLRDHSQWLYRTTWENPTPDVEITHLEVVSYTPDTWLALFGVTVNP